MKIYVRLPEKITYFHSKLGYPQNCVSAYNKCRSDIESCGVEVGEKEIAKTMYKHDFPFYKWEEANTLAKDAYFLKSKSIISYLEGLGEKK